MKNLKFMLTAICLSLITYSNITPDGKTNVYVEKSNNGVKIINISTPSNKGVSDSTFTDLSIDKTGAVINNATGIGRSHIAGIINPNKNLKNPARLALLRVTSTNKTEIKGVLEALTKDNLDVIVANKNGITLDGAKFLNIHDMTLTTGEVILKNGDIDNISVGDGLIVSLDELNTNNVNKLNILSKVARLEKDVIANKLDIRTGNNIYSINGENIELVKTIDGEIGAPISADILGSVYGDNIKIIATKSGIGAKSIVADKVSLDSKTQANIEKILSNELSIKADDDFNHKDKIIANKKLEIIAKNILNDNNILISDKIILNAKEDISNINGGLIHGDVSLNINSNTLNNKGKVLSYGDSKIKYIDVKTGKEVELSSWLSNHKEVYNSYNALLESSTTEAKENALRAFYDEVVHIDPKEFDWRVYKDDYEAGENKKRDGTKGKFFDSFTKDQLELIKAENRNIMNSDPSDNYEGSINLGKRIEAKVDVANKKTRFSVLSGNNININVKDTVNNKDAHIIANENNDINAKIFNNSSSISDDALTLKDGYEKMKFTGTFDCSGLVACSIKHIAEHVKELDDERKVFIKAKPSYLKGNNININADTVNFKDEDKKTLRDADEIFKNTKESVWVNNKKIEYEIEDDPTYVSKKNFYKNPYFLESIKDSNKYNPKEFEISDKVIIENEKREYKPSNISINASNLNLENQKLLFNNIKLSSNNILIKGAKLEALASLDVDKNDNIKIISSDVLAGEKINIVSNNIKIEDNKEKTEKVTKTVLENSDGYVLLDKEEKETIERSNKSSLKAKNIDIKAKNLDVVASDIKADEKLKLNVDNINILNSVSNNKKELKSKSGSTAFKHRINESYELETSNASNIEANNIEIVSKNMKTKGSNILANEDINISSDKLLVLSDVLNQKVDKNHTFLTDEDKFNQNKEYNEQSNIVAKNVKISTGNFKLKGSNLLANEKILINADNVDIQEQELITKTSKKDVKTGVYANASIDLSGIKTEVGIKHHNNKEKELEIRNAKSNLVAKDIEIKSKNDINSSADILSENLELKAKNVNLKDTKNKLDISTDKTNFNLGITANVGSVILDVASSVESLIVGEENKLSFSASTENGIKTNHWLSGNENKSSFVKTGLDKFRNIRNASSGIHSINKIISNGNIKGLISANVGAKLNVSNTKGKVEAEQSEKGNINSKNIKIIAEDKVILTNQKITSENLTIEADKLELKQGKNSKITRNDKVNVGLEVSYDVVNQVPSGSVSGGYSNDYSKDVTYEDNELNVENLKLKVNEIKKEDNKEIHEKQDFSIGANVGTNGFGFNVSKDGYGIGASVSRNGKIQNVTAKIDGESYDLHADLIHKENRDKLVDDISNVINTPGAYIKAIDTTISINNTNIFSEIQKAMLDNNVNTETSLRKYKDLLENAKNNNEKISIVKSYYKEIGKLGGKDFKDVVFIDNITNAKGEIAKAATSKDDVLYVNINNVDILDLDAMKDLVTYETKRWKYEDEEVDDNSLHYKQKEIKESKTKINVQTRTLTMEEMSKLRNYTYVPTFSDKQIENEQKKLEKADLPIKYKSKYNKLNDKQKRIVAENMLLKKELLKEEKIDDIESMKFFIDNPNNVFTAIDTKGYTVDEIRKIAHLGYKKEDEIKKLLEKDKNLKLKKTIKDSKTGLDGYILEKNGELIVVFRGTEKYKIFTDVKNDFQLANRNNDQYLKAYEEMNEFLNGNPEYKNKVILFTGHSLGGGIANYLTQRMKNTQAITFDPAPVVLDETIKLEKASRKKEEDAYKDVLSVIPKNGLLNRTTSDPYKAIVNNNITSRVGKSTLGIIEFYIGLNNNSIPLMISGYNNLSIKYIENVAYQNSINQNDIQKFEITGSHKNGKVDKKANKFVLPFKRKVKK